MFSTFPPERCVMLEARLHTETTGEEVFFEFTVSNADDQPVDLRFRDACRADVAVLADGEEVWRWSDGQMFAQAVEEARLNPGESAAFEFEWSDPEPGTYRAVGELRLLDRQCTAGTDLRVE